MDGKNLPLVSVPVITYNSSATVIETLDSIYNQTYPNIELIVSDDCSTDNTVELCREWIESHKERFARTELLTVEKNTGVAGNCNRSGAACRGEWSKGIAGDDILMPNCIQDCVDYVTVHPDTIWLFGKMEGFGRSQDDVDEYMNKCYNYSFFQLQPEEQLRYLTFKGNCLPAPAAFVNIEGNKNTGVVNDERIPMLEDHPKWINLIRAGVKLHFIDKTIVKYRLSDNSLSTTTKPNPKAVKSKALFTVYYTCPLMWQFGKKGLAIHKYINAAPEAFGGMFWKSVYKIDRILTKTLIKCGVVKSGSARREFGA